MRTQTTTMRARMTSHFPEPLALMVAKIVAIHFPSAMTTTVTTLMLSCPLQTRSGS